MAMKEGGDIHDETQPAVFDSVEQAVKEYQSKLLTPELVTMVHQTIWRERGKLVGAAYEVSPCPYTQEELSALEQQGKRVGYLPAELATQKNRHILGQMFPQMESHSVQKNNSVTNNGNPSGWFDYETAIEASYLDTTEEQLREKVAEVGRRLLSLNQYIVAGQDSQLLTGYYLDNYLDEKRTWTRLDSRGGGRIAYAGFGRGGRLAVSWGLGSGYPRRGLGGRSSGVKKA